MSSKEAWWRGSIWSLKIRWLIVLSAITMDIPAKMLDTKNRSGMLVEYHSGWILLEAIRNRAPRPDWWSVESVMPKMTAAVVQSFAYLRPVQPLRDRRKDLHELADRVQQEVPCHQEQDRAVAEGVPDDRVDDVPGTPQVQQQGAGVEAVRQEPVEDGGPQDRLVLLEVQDVDDEAQRVRAAGERHARHDVETDPDPPGVILGEVRDGGEPEGEADDDDHEPDRDDPAADDVEGRQDLPLGLEFPEDEVQEPEDGVRSRGGLGEGEGGGAILFHVL